MSATNPERERRCFAPTGSSSTIPTATCRRSAASRFEIDEAESVAITGPSGCGKSTLLHLLGGLDRPTQGDVYFRGKALSKLDIDDFRARQVGFVFQSFYLMPTLTALENIQIPMFEGPYSAAERTQRARAPDRGSRSRRPAALIDPRSSPSASASGSRSRAHSPTTHHCSWPTSRPATSIARARTRSFNCCTTCATRASSRS